MEVAVEASGAVAICVLGDAVVGRGLSNAGKRDERRRRCRRPSRKQCIHAMIGSTQGGASPVSTETASIAGEFKPSAGLGALCNHIDDGNKGAGAIKRGTGPRTISMRSIKSNRTRDLDVANWADRSSEA